MSTRRSESKQAVDLDDEGAIAELRETAGQEIGVPFLRVD